MNSRHSDNVTFDVRFGGELVSSVFFTVDDRLITVSVAGRKRTMKLGTHPPLALAESIAVELLKEKAAAELANLPDSKANWIGDFAHRLFSDSRTILHVQGRA
jgi:hypothetical protein